MYHPELFKDKVALVTGGRSGIGFAIAKQILELGGKVVICSRKEAALEEAKNKLNAFGVCKALPCDIRNTEQIAELVRFIKSEYGRLDILVNNAGGQFPSIAEKLSEKGWNAVINNNLNGTFYMTQAMANAFFIPQKTGNIVNIIINIFRGFPSMVHSSAARAGVESMSKTLAAEWARFNIRLNCVAPGTIKSSGLDTYPEPVQQLFSKMEEDNLMKRLGTVEEVSNAVCFLASPLSSYTSGISIYVDGMDHLHSNRMGLNDLLRSYENQ